MTALAPTWFEDNDQRDLKRWTMAAVIVVGLHLAAIAGYVYIDRPDEIGDESSEISIQLAPSDSDINQPEVAPMPEEQEKQVEQPPPDVSPAITALPEQKPVEEEKKPPVQAAPARTKGGAPHVAAAWQTSLVKHLQQFKRYPSEAQSRGEEGVVLLSFSVDRAGHVLAHQIVRSSGHAELDAEVMSMIERAQPLPPFSPDMPDAKLDLTVPIRFSLR